MLNKVFDTKLVEVFQSSEMTIKALTGSHNLIFELKSTKRTGNMFGSTVYNELFVRLKSKYYSPITHQIQSEKVLKSILKYDKRKEKIKKYYLGGYYNEIENVVVLGRDVYLALPHLLSLWPDYDLIREYYKKAPLKEIDQILWVKYVYNNLYSHIIQSEELLIRTKRFNIFGFLEWCNRPDVPLFYNDGILLASSYNMFNDLSVYRGKSVKEVVRNLAKKLTSQDLKKEDFVENGNYMVSWFLTKKIFPYLFTLVMTDYGHVLNLYKFNLKTLQYDLILVKPVYEYCELVKKEALNNNIESGTVRVEDLRGFEKMFYRDYYFGVDEEYAYFYFDWYSSKKPKYSFKLFKIPLNQISVIKLRNGKMEIKSKKGAVKFLNSHPFNITTVITPSK